VPDEPVEVVRGRSGLIVGVKLVVELCRRRSPLSEKLTREGEGFGIASPPGVSLDRSVLCATAELVDIRRLRLRESVMSRSSEK